MKTLNKKRKIAEKLKWVYLQNYLYLICLLSQTNKLGSKYMLEHSTFYAMIGYANHVMIIFLNIDLNFRKERKMVIKLRGGGYQKNYSYLSC